MKKYAQFLALILFTFVLTACGGGGGYYTTQQGGGQGQQNQQQPPSHEADAPARSADGVYVLFVGNSFVFFGDMPSQLAAIAAANGINLIYTDISRGGFNLLDHEANAIAEMQRFQYDFVVFQDQSQRPIFYPEHFLDDVYFLSHMTRQSGAVPVLYNPAWANVDGWPDVDTQNFLSLVYAIGAYESDALMVNAGDAWVFAYYSEPSLQLYHEDMFHANYAGAFFTAAVFAATMLNLEITNIPQNLPYTGDALPLLAQLAWEFATEHDFVDIFAY